MHRLDDIATRLLGSRYDTLDERTKRIARHIAERRPISRNVEEDADVG